MKKTTAILLSVFILVLGTFNVFASNVTNRVYADTVTVESGGQVTVPIKIENNDGFMGFSITVTYDSDVVIPVSVSKGSILNGMFNDSIETSTDNSFKVIYTGTDDIVSDGELFCILFDVSKNASGVCDIELSYSQQDTFKEGWINAVFNCEDSKVIITVDGTTALSPETEPTTHITDSTNESSSHKEDPTKPQEEPDENTKPLSVRMREWVGGLIVPLNIILGIFVYPISYIISIFE